MTNISEFHRCWSKDADCKNAYDAPGEEFDLARELIEARTAAGLSQAQLPRRMKTSQSYIARIQGGKVRPSTDALERFAQYMYPPADHLRPASGLMRVALFALRSAAVWAHDVRASRLLLRA